MTWLENWFKKLFYNSKDLLLLKMAWLENEHISQDDELSRFTAVKNDMVRKPVIYLILIFDGFTAVKNDMVRKQSMDWKSYIA